MKPKIDGFHYTDFKNFCLRYDTVCEINRQMIDYEINVKRLISKVYKKCLEVYQKIRETQGKLDKRCEQIIFRRDSHY